MKREKETKLYLHLKKWLEKAIMDYGMIAEGDRVLVGVSGGADSLALLDLLVSPMVFVPPFEILAVNIDPGFDPSYEACDLLARYLEESGCNCILEKTDIGVLAHSDYNKKNPCFLCSRLRRKRLFEIAAKQGCNKIALGHHRDDIIETLLINMFFGREISTMLPKQKVFAGRMHIIRPFAYIREGLIKKYAVERRLPIVESKCPSHGNSKRRYIKELLNNIEQENSEVRNNIWRALAHVKVDYLPDRIENIP
ncbi:MAG: ATP-binding protein [Smithellaceae bacterium]|nr:ATP-binding protein [Smithellaceae bacterium]